MLIKKLKNIVVCGAIALSNIILFSGCDTSGELIDETTALSSITLFSGCDTSGELIDETTAITTAESLSDEELDALAENMPEIVFVMSHHYDDTNILGCYITNTGEMKMYDFRNIAPDEIYEIPDVYDRLGEATCSELNFRGGVGNSENIIENDMVNISKNELIEYYKKMPLITKEPIYESLVPVTMEYGHYRYYGIVNGTSGEQELVFLGGTGSSYCFRNDDLYWHDVYYWIIKKFPCNFIYNS